MLFSPGQYRLEFPNLGVSLLFVMQIQLAHSTSVARDFEGKRRGAHMKFLLPVNHE